MNLRIAAVVAVLLMTPLGTLAAGAFTALHPEEAYPDPTEQPSADAYTGFISRVQQRLRELGFAAGPLNGDFGSKTQAALAQFQLSRAIPASGQLDDRTLAELGVKRDDPQESAVASTGSTTAPAPSSAGDPATVTSPAGSSSERTAEPKPPGRAEPTPEPKTGEKPGG
jgi:peptidoglycan hydrolase-like protein with peptidoglycan-binding domain